MKNQVGPAAPWRRLVAFGLIAGILGLGGCSPEGTGSVKIAGGGNAKQDRFKRLEEAKAKAQARPTGRPPRRR